MKLDEVHHDHQRITTRAFRSTGVQVMRRVYEIKADWSIWESVRGTQQSQNISSHFSSPLPGRVLGLVVQNVWLIMITGFAMMLYNPPIVELFVLLFTLVFCSDRAKQKLWSGHWKILHLLIWRLAISGWRYGSEANVCKMRHGAHELYSDSIAVMCSSRVTIRVQYPRSSPFPKFHYPQKYKAHNLSSIIMYWNFIQCYGYSL